MSRKAKIAVAVAVMTLIYCGTAWAKTIHLNSTTVRELVIETGIPVEQARLIISYRNQIGHFTTLDQLYDVPDIDPEVASELREDTGVEL